MPIFFVLNGLGLVFLLYVLVNFWKEGRRTKGATRHRTTGGERPRGFKGIVVTHPISHTAQGGISVMPLRVPVRPAGDKPGLGVGLHQVVEMPVKGMSTNSAAKDLPHRARIAAKEGPRC